MFKTLEGGEGKVQQFLVIKGIKDYGSGGRTEKRPGSGGMLGWKDDRVGRMHPSGIEQQREMPWGTGGESN